VSIWSAAVSIEVEGVRQTVRVPPLASRVRAALAADQSGARAAEPLATPSPAPATSSPDEPSTSPQELAGWIVGATGAAAAGIAIGFGVRSIAAASQSGDHCDEHDYCDEVGLGLRRDAIDARTTALSVGIPGAALLGVGILLVATVPGPDDDAAPPAALKWIVMPGGLWLRGRL
jgi:hypothetical protein